MNAETITAITELINRYMNRYPLAKECGGEYVWQNEEAEEDAVYLVAGIVDILQKAK